MKFPVPMWPSRLRPPPWTVWAVLAMAAGLFVWQCLSLGNILIDDAFITFSYSKNLARGNGPVYSHGLRTEGYSNFLWMIVVAMPLAVARHMDPVWAARLMGAPFVVLLGWATFRLTVIGTGSRLVGALAVLFLATATDIAIAYLCGLETVPYTAFLVTSFALLLSSWHGNDQRARTLAPWCALGAALTRIDGFVVLALVIACDLGRTLFTRRRIELIASMKWAGPAVLTFLTWFAWRYWYYGLPLPSTYYAKALIPTLLPDRGFNYVRDELTSSGLFVAAFAATWLLARGRVWTVPLLVGVAVQIAYVVRVGGDWMPFGRFLLPVVPLMVVVLCAGVVEVIRTIPAERRVGRFMVATAMLGVVIATAGRLDHRWWNDGLEDGKLYIAREQKQHVKDLRRAATFLNAAVPVGRRLVTDYAGVMGYYTNAAVIDMWGLATPTIARRGNVERVQPIYGRTCPECYPELNPEFFHVVSPLVRPLPAFTSAADVIGNVWQTDTIGRYIDFPNGFAVGRVIDKQRGDALYFLEKRGPGFSSAPRATDAFKIEYPFEPGGIRPG